MRRLLLVVILSSSSSTCAPPAAPTVVRDADEVGKRGPGRNCRAMSPSCESLGGVCVRVDPADWNGWTKWACAITHPVGALPPPGAGR